MVNNTVSELHSLLGKFKDELDANSFDLAAIKNAEIHSTRLVEQNKKELEVLKANISSLKKHLALENEKSLSEIKAKKAELLELIASNKAKSQEYQTSLNISNRLAKQNEEAIAEMKIEKEKYEKLVAEQAMKTQQLKLALDSYK